MCAAVVLQAQLFASDQAGKAARTVLVSTSNAGARVSATATTTAHYLAPGREASAQLCPGTGVVLVARSTSSAGRATVSATSCHMGFGAVSGVCCCCPCAGSGLLERVSAVLGSKVAAVLVPLEVKLQEEGVIITG